MKNFKLAANLRVWVDEQEVEESLHKMPPPAINVDFESVELQGYSSFKYALLL